MYTTPHHTTLQSYHNDRITIDGNIFEWTGSFGFVMKTKRKIIDFYELDEIIEKQM
jgi:hypothetical protein